MHGGRHILARGVYNLKIRLLLSENIANQVQQEIYRASTATLRHAADICDIAGGRL